MKFFGYEFVRVKKPKKKSTPIDASKDKTVVPLPAGRISSPSKGDSNSILNVADSINIIKPLKVLSYIPLIRSLYKYNEDLGAVLNDLIQLTNTGHHIKFDQDVDANLADKMREHLKEKSKSWSYGNAGIDGIVNKLIAQIWVSGAISIETPPDFMLNGVDNICLINPETIRFSMDKKGKYQPYQKVENRAGKIKKEYIKLNTSTYIYYSLLGDEDVPYGVPPFLTALSALSTQKEMKDNINHILGQLGLLGYLEVKMAKPSKKGTDSQKKYEQGLTELLKTTKQNILSGFKDGVVVGFDEDHEFEFHSTTKNLSGVSDIFNLNEVQIANGLKSSGSFIGLDTAGGEGQLGIVFTKMLSQLKNVQGIIAEALAHTYKLELRLAGYNFTSLEVEFHSSTITDELKLQQGKEIKQRVLRGLWIDRIISSNIYAEEMGYSKPYKEIEPPEPGQTNDSNKQKDKEDRKKDKGDSEKKGRDKGKQQPKRKDSR